MNPKYAGCLILVAHVVVPGIAAAQVEKTERSQAPANVLRPGKVDATPERIS